MKDEEDIDMEELTKTANSIIEGSYTASSPDSGLSFISTDYKIRDEINSHLEIYNKKYGKNFSFHSIQENLQNAAELTKLERNELIAIFGNDIAVSSFFVEYKAVKTVLGYFDKFLNSVSNNEQVVAEEFSAAIVKVILDFIPKIAKLREKYSVSNIDNIINSDSNITKNRANDNKEFQRLRSKLTDED